MEVCTCNHHKHRHDGACQADFCDCPRFVLKEQS